MLVLTRKAAETIRIGESVVIKVIRCGRSSVKIGVDAPSSVRVIRGELTTRPTTAGKGAADWFPGPERHPEMVHACSDQFPHPHIG